MPNAPIETVRSFTVVYDATTAVTTAVATCDLDMAGRVGSRGMVGPWTGSARRRGRRRRHARAGRRELRRGEAHGVRIRVPLLVRGLYRTRPGDAGRSGGAGCPSSRRLVPPAAALHDPRLVDQSADRLGRRGAPSHHQRVPAIGVVPEDVLRARLQLHVDRVAAHGLGQQRQAPGHAAGPEQMPAGFHEERPGAQRARNAQRSSRRAIEAAQDERVVGVQAQRRDGRRRVGGRAVERDARMRKRRAATDRRRGPCGPERRERRTPAPAARSRGASAAQGPLPGWVPSGAARLRPTAACASRTRPGR